MADFKSASITNRPSVRHGQSPMIDYNAACVHTGDMPMLTFKPRKCSVCDEAFQPAGNRQVTCSPQCTLDHYSALMPSGCVEWTAAKHEKGYGILRIGGRQHRAHRLAWELANGPIPAGMLVLHSCDNPACLNLKHLSIGSAAENTADMLAKRRNRAGDECSWSILKEEEVIFIKAELAKGVRGTKYQLAKRFGVSFAAIADIATGKTWKNVGSA